MPKFTQTLQKLEAFAGMNATQLLEVASKVVVNQEHEEKREADEKMKAKVSFLVVALGKPDLTKQSALPQKGRPNGRTPLQ
jgi:RNase P/RNase MRP subunit p30